jgi:hypothetical protein
MPNNHYHFVKYALALCFLLGACTPAQQTLIPATPITSPTVEATPTIISTPTLEGQGQKDLLHSPCLSVNPESPEGNPIPWLLLVSRAAVYAIDPNTGERTDELIPSPEDIDPFAYDFALSPDGKWIAYVLSGENDDLVVEPSNNLLTKSSQGRIIWHPENLFQLHGWLSNESVALRIYRSPDRFASTLIRNLFNEKEYEFFLEELPDYLYYQPGGLQGTLLFAHSNLMPDPTLKRVVYPAINADHYYQAALCRSFA